MTKRAFIAGVSLAVLLFGFLLWGRGKQVTVDSVSRGSAVRAVYATGAVEPEVLIAIAPQVSARLTELLVDEGQQVQKGDVLARLDGTELLSALEEMKSRQWIAEREVVRRRELVSRGAVSRGELERTEAELLSVNSLRDAAEARLSHATIFAPAPGMVVRRDGEIGELLSPQKTLFWVSGSSSLRITAEVDEEDVALLEVGQEVLVRSDAFPGDVVKGTIASITPKGDPIARSFRVRVSIPDGSRLKIGMTTEINVIAKREENALLVPTSAMDGSHLWVVTDGRLSKRSPVFGIRGADRTQVVSGLEEGEMVVVSPSDRLREGMRVRALHR